MVVFRLVIGGLNSWGCPERLLVTRTFHLGAFASYHFHMHNFSAFYTTPTRRVWCVILSVSLAGGVDKWLRSPDKQQLPIHPWCRDSFISDDQHTCVHTLLHLYQGCHPTLYSWTVSSKEWYFARKPCCALKPPTCNLSKPHPSHFLRLYHLDQPSQFDDAIKGYCYFKHHQQTRSFNPRPPDSDSRLYSPSYRGAQPHLPCLGCIMSLCSILDSHYLSSLLADHRVVFFRCFGQSYNGKGRGARKNFACNVLLLIPACLVRCQWYF